MFIPATPPACTQPPGYSPSSPQLRVLPHHLREGIVPQDGGFGVIVLVAVDDDHQGQRQGLKQGRKGSSWYWGTRGPLQKVGSECARKLLNSHHIVKNSWCVIECFLKLNYGLPAETW